MNHPLGRAVLLLGSFLALAGPGARGADDIVIADFEGADYGGWTTTGTAFGTGPAHGSLNRQQPVTGFMGKGLVNTYMNEDRSTGTLTSPAFTIERNAIAFLIGGGAIEGRTCINLKVDGKVVRTATGAEDEKLDWFAWDVKDLKGKSAEIEVVDRANGGWGHINVDQIVQTDKPPVVDSTDAPLYGERLRPQFHFTAAQHWLNDPNGLCFYDGEYHLFYQHNPFGNQSGNLSWGHSVSKDLVHWAPLEIAIKPDAMGAIWSGSAVVDENNTTGFQTGAEKPMVAIYTAAGGTTPESKGHVFTQCITYSLDRGRTWTKYDKNPVLQHIIGGDRDPKLVWFEPGKKWVMALYLDKTTYGLFSSPNLKDWTHLQDIDFKGSSECPDFFPMPVDGDAAKTKWVMTGANAHYMVGSFDGKAFAPETPPQQVDFGRNFYAVQSFSGLADGRRVQIAWMNGGRYPRMPFNQQMSFPSDLKLVTTAEGPRLRRSPAPEIEKLWGEESKWQDVTLDPAKKVFAPEAGDCFDMSVELEPGKAEQVVFNIRGQAITYDTASQTLDALGKAVVHLVDGKLKLRMLVDRTSIETFAADGAVAMGSCFIGKAGAADLEIVPKGGTVHVVSLTLHRVNSIWPAAAGEKAAEPRGGGK